MNRGDTVQLIVPEKGRKCVGKILREIKAVTKWDCPMVYILFYRKTDGNFVINQFQCQII